MTCMHHAHPDQCTCRALSCAGQPKAAHGLVPAASTRDTFSRPETRQAHGNNEYQTPFARHKSSCMVSAVPQHSGRNVFTTAKGPQ